MQESSIRNTSMSVDLKKYGIRLHKSCYRLLGEPKYIQLLVNPQTMMVAVRSNNQNAPGDCNHKINTKRMSADHSYEIYSRPFVQKLCEIVEGLNDGNSYKIYGTVFPKDRVALFDLRTISDSVQHQEHQP